VIVVTNKLRKFWKELKKELKDMDVEK